MQKIALHCTVIDNFSYLLRSLPLTSQIIYVSENIVLCLVGRLQSILLTGMSSRPASSKSRPASSGSVRAGSVAKLRAASARSVRSQSRPGQSCLFVRLVSPSLQPVQRRGRSQRHLRGVKGVRMTSLSWRRRTTSRRKAAGMASPTLSGECGQPEK